MWAVVDKWIRRVGAAALVVASVLGCGGGCTAGPGPRPEVPDAGPAAPFPSVVGVWRVDVNGAAQVPTFAFLPGGTLVTTDPGIGVWRARKDGRVEGAFSIPAARLTVTYVLAVAGDQLTGTGVAANPELAGPPNYRRLTMKGVRLAVDPAAVAEAERGS